MANAVTWSSEEGETKKSTTFHVGDTLRVHYKLIEKEKVSGKAKREVHEETHERTQVYEGIALAIKGSGPNTMFMVRHMGVGAIGVERIFPLVSPWIKNIEVKKHALVRRAKLYYLRNRQGKGATRLSQSSQKSA